MYVYFYETELGKMGIAEEDGKITNVYFSSESVPASLEIKETELLKEAGRQLKEYFSGNLKEFSLPLAPKGTEFMGKVWSALCKIPYGKTATYKEIAESIGNSKACRAVGLANNRNPIPIIIPCHRVIGANGSLTGYAGGLDMKKRLLDLEKLI